MTVAATARLTLHFTAGELRADDPAATVAVVTNLHRTAGWLEVARTVLGDTPIVVTSGFRTAAQNSAAGGALTTDHDVGLAADFTVPGLTPFQVYQRLTAAQHAGTLPPFDQLIYYQTDDHVHVGLGPRLRGQVYVRTKEGAYVELVSRALSLLRGWV